MPVKPRRRFRTNQEWHNFVQELQQTQTGVNLYELRRGCYEDIERERERPLLVYAVDFNVPPALAAHISIGIEDIDGFTDLVDAVEKDVEGIDILLHSPGGSPEAAERIVSVIRSRFKNVAFLVPHSAYSAATMIALSGDEIILHPAACLGPIDPQISGVPARVLKRGFENAREAIRQGGPEVMPAYLPLIEKVSLELLEICDDSEKLSSELVSEWLSEYMFRTTPGESGGQEDRAEVIGRAVTFFSSYDDHKTHGRPLTFEKVKGLGLNITLATDELRSLMREAHVLLTGGFGITPFVKLYENAHGLSWGRQVNINTIPAPATPGP